MFKSFENHGKFEFYAEKRLLFKAPEKPKIPTDAEILASISGQLGTLRGEVGKPSGTPKDKPTYHTDRRDTRELVAPPPNYPGAVEQVTEALTLGGYMSKQEVEMMQGVHENLYEQYMNPAFMLYLKQLGFYDTVYPALELVLKYPYDFEYITRGNQRLEIVKRRPYKNSAIPDTFSVIMETTEGYITMVNGVNLRMEGSTDVPWMPNSEYNKKMKDYREQWMNEYVRLRNSGWETKVANLPSGEPERSRQWYNLLVEPFQRISGDVKELYELDNIEFPKRFIALVQSRNLGFELDDPRFKDIVEHQKLQGKSYEEITQEITPGGDRPKLHVIVMADPDMPDVYRIYTKGALRKEPLRVTREGFMLRDMGETASPRWVIDPRYHQALGQRYYRENPKAKGKLTTAERTKMEEDERQAKQRDADEKKRAEDERKKAEETAARLKEAHEKRPKVDEALKKADLPKLGEVAIAISPEEFHASIDKLVTAKNKKMLLKGIEDILKEDTDGSLTIKAAKILEAGSPT